MPLVQHEGLTARELGRQLELADAEALRQWVARLLDWGLVQQTGRTQATRYFVDPGLVRRLEFPAATSLRRIEPHRLRALLIEDLERYPESAIGEIHRRIGAEIPRSQVKRMLDSLVAGGECALPRGEAVASIPDRGMKLSHKTTRIERRRAIRRLR
ncbi:MAG: hypothetical protein M0037_03490 [Betaproteobacteria bacterium]|nr:hypothetical protein [Betaproteobacteria bacterium]